jgi:type IV pilus assembly protein PilE
MGAAAGRPGGFSLTELMIALAIIAILAAIALPTYRQYVIRSNRGDATQALLRIAAEQERYYLANNSYAATIGEAGLGMSSTSEHGWYALSVTAGDMNGFEARAVPAADSPQKGDAKCQVFTIDADGRKAAEDDAGAPTDDTCWR